MKEEKETPAVEEAVVKTKGEKKRKEKKRGLYEEAEETKEEGRRGRRRIYEEKEG